MLVDHLLKTKKEFKNLKKQEIQTIFTKMNLIKHAFNMIWLMEIVKIARRTASGKILRDKAFNIAKNSKYDGYQRGIASMVYKFFDKKSVGSGLNKHANNKCPLVLAEELQKPDIRKLKKQQFIQDLKTIFGELV